MMDTENSSPRLPVSSENPDVICGHRVCQTSDAKWLCIENVYEKFHRPNFYDVGGTYIEDVVDYWFTCKIEQVANIFLLHLFVGSHAESSFTVSVSCGNEFNVNKRNNIVYLPLFLKKYRCKVKDLSHVYLTTYSFSDLDVELLRDKKLFIAVSFLSTANQGINHDIIDNYKINHDCSALLNDPIGSDFTIESSDGIKFHIHKVILAAHSEVFKAMLKEETAESQNSYVKLVDVNEEDLRYMLEYIYTGTVKDVGNANFINLLMLGDRYNLQGLQELSRHALSQQLNADNAIDILVVADMYDADSLKNTAMKFIKRNCTALENSAFKDINNPVLMKQLCTYLASS